MNSSLSEAQRKRLIWVLGALCALGPLSIDAYLPALPTIEHELVHGSGSAEFTLAAYFFGLSASQLFWGPIGDRYGRRKPLLSGLALYGVSSLCAMLAPSLWPLVIARFFQAVGGAASVVLVRSIVRDTWPTTEGAKVLSQLVLVMGAAPILAPSMGGALLAFASWRAIFGVLTVASLVLFGVVYFTIEEGHTGAISVSLSERVGLVLRDPVFLYFTATVGFAQSAMFAYISASPTVFTEIVGLSPQVFAIVFGTNAACYIVGAQLNRWLLSHHPLLQVLGGGVAALMGVALVLWLSVWGGLGWVLMEVALLCMLGLLGIIVANAMAMSIDRQEARAGLASGMLGTFQYGISACASAAVGLFADGTARPMVGLIVFFVFAAGLAFVGGRRAAEEGEPVVTSP